MSIYIDLDGPILDVSEKHYRVYRKIVIILGGRPLKKQLYWQLKKNRSHTTILHLSKIVDPKNRFEKIWLELIERKSYLKYDRVFPLTKKVLKSVKKHCNLILVTLREHPRNLSWQLKTLGLKFYFDEVLTAKENRGEWLTKYRLIKQSSFLNPDSWLIGDTEVDILTGRKIGLRTIALLSGVRNKKILLNYKPDYILNSLREIWKVLRP
jgi:phosphoglycolate phosphatase-like HAD superfamily hydrolase